MFPMTKRNRRTEKNAQKWFDWRHNDVNLLNVDEMNNDNGFYTRASTICDFEDILRVVHNSLHVAN